LPGLVVLLLTTGSLQAEGLQEDMRKGVELYQSGRLEEASRQFLQILDQDPSSEEARLNLANTLAALGQKRFMAGQWEEARDYLEKAIEYQPDEAAFHFLLGVIHFKQGDLYSARWEAEEALDKDPRYTVARNLLGDIYYREGQLNQALWEWEEALENAGNQEAKIREKIRRVRKEAEAERGFERDISRHFTLQSDGPVPREVSQKVLRDLEEGYEEIGYKLGHYPRSDIPVILYSKVLFKEITRSPSWVAGRYDGKIRVPVGGLSRGGDARDLRPVLYHELTHAFLRSMAPQGLPRWFEEGLAKYFEGVTPEAALRWLEMHPEPRFSSFEELNIGLKGKPGLVDAAYINSFMAVWTLIEDQGLWTVTRIIEEVGRGRPFPEAFRGEVRLDLAEFKEKWLESIP
jgi:Tfp pilus assembly protein PilF